MDANTSNSRSWIACQLCNIVPQFKVRKWLPPINLKHALPNGYLNLHEGKSQL